MQPQPRGEPDAVDPAAGSADVDQQHLQALGGVCAPALGRAEQYVELQVTQRDGLPPVQSQPDPAGVGGGQGDVQVTDWQVQAARAGRGETGQHREYAGQRMG